MSRAKQPLSLISEAKRKSSIEAIQTFFKSTHDLDLGLIAAEDILDFFLQNVGPDVYNKGVQDSQGILKSQLENLDIELNLLFKSP